MGKYIFVSRPRGVLGGAVGDSIPLTPTLCCTQSLSLCHPLLLAPQGAKIIQFSPTMYPDPPGWLGITLNADFLGYSGWSMPSHPTLGCSPWGDHWWHRWLLANLTTVYGNRNIFHCRLQCLCLLGARHLAGLVAALIFFVGSWGNVRVVQADASPSCPKAEVDP